MSPMGTPTSSLPGSSPCRHLVLLLMTSFHYLPPAIELLAKQVWYRSQVRIRQLFFARCSYHLFAPRHRVTPGDCRNDDHPSYLRQAQPSGMLPDLLFLVYCHSPSSSSYSRYSVPWVARSVQVRVAQTTLECKQARFASLGQEIPVPRYRLHWVFPKTV